jgi:hypothetical protein
VRIENNRHFRDSRTKGVQRRMTLHLDKAHATGRAISRISRIQQHSRKKYQKAFSHRVQAQVLYQIKRLKTRRSQSCRKLPPVAGMLLAQKWNVVVCA